VYPEPGFALIISRTSAVLHLDLTLQDEQPANGASR